MLRLILLFFVASQFVGSFSSVLASSRPASPELEIESKATPSISSGPSVGQVRVFASHNYPTCLTGGAGDEEGEEEMEELEE